MADRLSTEILLNLPDAKVKSAVTSQFITQMKCVPSVMVTFFSNPLPTETVTPKDPSYVANMATAFVCSAIAQSSLHGFSAAINKTAAENYWKNGLSDTNASAIAEGQNLYSWAFPGYCAANGVSFLEFLQNDPKGWAEKLSQYVTTDPYIDTTINKILSDPGWLDQLNLTLYKIDRLDPTKSAGVVDVWRKAYPAKNIVKNWEERNFIPEANFATVPEQLLGAVNRAIAFRSIYENTGSDDGTGGFTQPVYGWEVAYNFLGIKAPYPKMQQTTDTLARRLGFLTGAPLNNWGQSHSNAGCFIAGTPVRLADGRSSPIEQIREGDRVLGQDGGVSIQTGEQVGIDFPDGGEIYGIDDGANGTEPFFSAGHIFWTADGWKAIDPGVALMENPDRQIGTLGVGDRVFRLKATDPIDYEEVVVKGFTKRVLAKGETLHGLHLVDGPRSYHANGYLVGMNYPILTICRLAEGFGRLTEAETKPTRRLVAPSLMLRAEMLSC